MLLTRTLALGLRLAQLITAVIVLSLVSVFLHQRTKYSSDSAFDRFIYSLVIAILSIVLSLAWMLPTTAHIMIHGATDLLLAAAWFAVFGVLQDWYSDDEGMGCGRGSWDWDRIRFWGNSCGQWNAAQAFAFMAAMLWFVSFVLGLLAWAKRDRAVGPLGEGTTGPAPAAAG
ncbi:hypothetical protein DE146DRAFT_753974 [Phaeosphaeria sp. MPI-PUGE-AT-0046c]|nr:hypothetical protein DE146DRAFT_753974 [Phaeosphaeria sp. MPI-PUGE-AT-0046c]